jgi:hypothetical protein
MVFVEEGLDLGALVQDPVMNVPWNEALEQLVIGSSEHLLRSGIRR